MISINWEAFTPYPALLGGLMIGVSAVMLILLTGRVAGISGILGGLIKPQSNETLWRFTFVLGMVAAPWLYLATMGSFEFESPRGPLALIVAGLLGGLRYTAWFGLHQRSRCVWLVAPVASFIGGHRYFHGGWFCGRVRVHARHLSGRTS